MEESQRGHSPTKRQNSNAKGGDKTEGSRSGSDGKVNQEAAERDADPAKGSNLHEGDPDSAEPVTLRARNQLGLDPESKESQQTFDLESRWAGIEAILFHEREFWPLEYHRELCVRIVGWVSGWASTKEEQHLPIRAEPVPVAVREMIAIPEAPAAPATNTDGQAACRLVFAHWDKLNWRLSNRDLEPQAGHGRTPDHPAPDNWGNQGAWDRDRWRQRSPIGRIPSSWISFLNQSSFCPATRFKPKTGI